MQLPDRYAMYGLTGALFWALQVGLLIASGYGSVLSSFSHSSILAQFVALPDALQTLFATLLGVLAIAGVFFTGLILDLAAAYFTVLEISLFKSHLDSNASWLPTVVSAHVQSSTNDLEELRAHFGDPLAKRELLRGLRMLRVWQRSRRDEWKEEPRRIIKRFKLVKPYRRLSSFLLSYVILMSGSGDLTILHDQINQWRTARAVAAALVIVYFQAIFLDTRATSWLFLASALLIVGAFILTRATYDRVCYTLFSFAFMTREKHRVNAPVPQVGE